jgi:hypothetical protein
MMYLAQELGSASIGTWTAPLLRSKRPSATSLPRRRTSSPFAARRVGSSRTLLVAAAALWCFAVGVAGTAFARQLTALKWRHGLPLDKLLAIGGFEASVERAKIVGLCALLLGVALLVLVIHG